MDTRHFLPGKGSSRHTVSLCSSVYKVLWELGSRHQVSMKTSGIKGTDLLHKVPAAIGQINTMGKALQQRCNDGRTCTIERYHKGRLLTHIRRFQVCRGKPH